MYIFDDLVKSHIEAARWLSKKFDIQGVVFLAGARQYMWYVEALPKTYNAVDRTFYDAIIFGLQSFHASAHDIVTKIVDAPSVGNSKKII